MKNIDKPRDYMVYAITDLLTGKQYVGFTSCTLSTRRAITKYEARKKHKDGSWLYNSAIYLAVRDHGESLIWRVLERFHSDRDFAGEREVYWIKKLNTLHPNGLNQKEGGRRGKIITQSMVRISVMDRKAHNSWKNLSPAQRAARSEAIRRGMKAVGRKPEQNVAVAKAQKSRWERMTPEQRKAWQEKATAARVNTPMSAEGRAKIAAAQKARWERIRNEKKNEGRKN